MNINKNNLESVAMSVDPVDFNIPNMKEGISDYLTLLKAIHDNTPDETIELDKIGRLNDVWEVDGTRLKALRDIIESEKSLVFEVSFELTKIKPKIVTQKVSFRVGFLKPKRKQGCTETYHRFGMCIPKGPGKRSLNGKITGAVCADDDFLNDLLNDCEGKAHLSWGKSENIQKKLRETYKDGVAVRDLIALSLKDLYQKIMETGTELDSSIWAEILQAPAKPTPPPGPGPGPGPGPVPPPTPSGPGLYHSEEITNGFSIRGNEDFTFANPERIRVDVGYAREGESKPWEKWDDTDFELHLDRMINSSNVLKLTPVKGNAFEITVDRTDFRVEVTGFGSEREIAWNPRRIK